MRETDSTETVDLYLLHVDDLTVELHPDVDRERLAAELEAAMRDDSVLRVPVLPSTLENHTALVKASRARLVYITHRTAVVPRIGKPGV